MGLLEGQSRGLSLNCKILIRDDWGLPAVGIPDKRNNFNASPSSVGCKVRLSEGFAKYLLKTYKEGCVLKIDKVLYF